VTSRYPWPCAVEAVQELIDDACFPLHSCWSVASNQFRVSKFKRSIKSVSKLKRRIKTVSSEPNVFPVAFQRFAKCVSAKWWIFRSSFLVPSRGLKLCEFWVRRFERAKWEKCSAKWVLDTPDMAMAPLMAPWCHAALVAARIILPQSALDHLARLNISWPMLFEAARVSRRDLKRRGCQIGFEFANFESYVFFHRKLKKVSMYRYIKDIFSLVTIIPHGSPAKTWCQMTNPATSRSTHGGVQEFIAWGPRFHPGTEKWDLEIPLDFRPISTFLFQLQAKCFDVLWGRTLWPNISFMDSPAKMTWWRRFACATKRALPAQAEEGTCFFPYWMMSMPKLPEIDEHAL